MNDDINKKIKEALSSNLLESFGFNIINYLDLNQYDNIENVLNEEPIILYTPISEKMNGHYSCLWILNNQLFYWCSYGYDLNYTITKSNYMLSTPENDEDYLLRLVRKFVNNGGIFNVNQTKYQKLSPNVSTCGRYCMIRLLKRELSHDEFKDWFHLKKNPNISNDELITLLTFLI